MATSIRKRRYEYRRKRSLDPLHQLCGYWKSRSNSPPVRILRGSQGYLIRFEYHFGKPVTRTIHRQEDDYVTDLFGRTEIAYDGINDRLLIAGEGTYFRDYDREE